MEALARHHLEWALVREWLAGRMKTDLRSAIPALAAAAWRAVKKHSPPSRKS